MINYTDFGPYYSMEEAQERIAMAFFQALREIINIETLSTEHKAYRIRVWWRQK